MCSVEKVFLEISPNSQENTCARDSFLIKLQAQGLQLYLKRISGTGLFLWILRNFQEHVFYRSPPDNCFWTWTSSVSGVYIFKFTSRYCNNYFDLVRRKDRYLVFSFFKALLKSFILILLDTLYLKINIRTRKNFVFGHISRSGYFRKCRLIFWMGINYGRRPPFRNLFWILLRIWFCPPTIYMKIIFFTAVNIVTKIWTIVHKS